MENSMEITYIGHSGFLVTLPEVYFLFDYYQGDIPELEQSKELFIFASHFHKDHYNQEILKFFASHERSRFVVSRDIRIQKHLQKRYGEDVEMDQRVFSLKAGVEMELPVAMAAAKTQEVDTKVEPVVSEETAGNRSKMLKIETFRSTDMGVAYLLAYDGKKIYHAGDLNLWTWSGETKAYNHDMEKKFMNQMEKLRGRNIDIAFVPLDPRQEEDADKGMEVFLSVTNTRYAFPMHCWEQYDIIEKFKSKPEHQAYRTDIVSITGRGERFMIK